MGKHSAKKAKLEFERVYGSLDRVNWVRNQPCVVSGMVPCHNAHTAVGGTGYKADYRTIVPLHHLYHDELHRVGTATFEEKYHVTLTTEAERTEREWQRHLTTRNAARNNIEL